VGPAQRRALRRLYVVGFAIAGRGPKADGTAADVVTFFADNHRHVEIGLTIFTFALVFFVWWLATLAAILRKAGEARLASTAYGAGIVITAVFVLFAMVYGSLAFTAFMGKPDPGVEAAIYGLQWPLYQTIPALAAALALAVSIAGMRAKLLPDWFCWAGLVGAVAFAIDTTTWGHSGFWASGGTYAMITEFVFLAWVLVTSVLLLARPAPAA
jgi:hypothetical protein